MAQRLEQTCLGPCGRELPLTRFHRNNNYANGHIKWCKNCAKEKRRDTYNQKPQPRSLAPDDMKWCPQCSEFKTKDSFHKSKREGDGLLGECKICRRKRDEARDHYKKTYGVARSTVDALFAQQNQQCAACKTPLASLSEGRLDHCHETKRIRGILCHGCNVALGYLKDDPVRISGLLAYLKETI